VTDIAIALERPSLVQRAKRGDRLAFQRLIEDNAEGLLRLAKSIMLDPFAAQDVVQEGLIAAWRGLPGLRDPEAFDKWVRRIVANKAKTSLSRRRHHIQLPNDAAVEDNYDTIDLEGAIRRLEAKDRALLELHYLEGRTVQDCGYILEIPSGTVKSRLHTIRGQLRDLLRDE
jgi:RNA polymerase sigma-70 factor (ECF subfamily)